MDRGERFEDSMATRDRGWLAAVILVLVPAVITFSAVLIPRPPRPEADGVRRPDRSAGDSSRVLRTRSGLAEARFEALSSSQEQKRGQAPFRGGSVRRGSSARGEMGPDPSSADEGLLAALPQPLEPEHGYVGSAACRSCHREQHSAWHHSFHRTMTQPATPQAVHAPFDGVTLTTPEGWEYRLERRGDEFWIDMVDPDWDTERKARGEPRRADVRPPRVRKRVVMTTGSHHKQAFWVNSSRGRRLLRVPWSYRIDDVRWIPLENDFLAPPCAERGGRVWNDNCIRCHSTGGQPRYDAESQKYDTRVAELGVSCEACHGPGAEHVRVHSDPELSGRLLPRSQAPAWEREGGDPTIVNPLNLDSRRASAICGQCHTFHLQRDRQAFLARGTGFRPGRDLEEAFVIVRHPSSLPDSSLGTSEGLGTSEATDKGSGTREATINRLRRDPFFLSAKFWPDGTVRVSGRDYNGLLESPCFQEGEISCLSCHSMHGYEDRDDQLWPGLRGDQACTQCHSEPRFTEEIERHTRHPAASSGSRCYNCHMPHTTYGLFKAIRSHRIDSPAPPGSGTSERPNACNLCHLDRTRAWTDKWLKRWWAIPTFKRNQEDQAVAASLLWLLRGDAAQRAVAAWHMGWKPAQEASGRDWLAPFLAITLDDEYPAVRNVARRSLKTLPGFSDFDYDFLAEQGNRSAAVRRALEIWDRRPAPASNGPHLLIAPGGELLHERIKLLLRTQDRRPVYIDE